jgi:hypothetical protein
MIIKHYGRHEQGREDARTERQEGGWIFAQPTGKQWLPSRRVLDYV